MDQKFHRVGRDGLALPRRVSRRSVAPSYSKFGVDSKMHMGRESSHYNPEAEALKMQDALRKGKELRFYSMWRYATKFDIFLLVVGVLCAVACAAHLPYIIYTFGHLIGIGLDDSRCAYYNITRPFKNKKLTKAAVLDFSRTTIIFATSMSLLCYGFTACFSFAAENQVYKLRIAYLESIIRKDMSWLDNYVDREFGRHMTHDITQIRAGIGEKVPYLIYVITVVISLVVTAIYAEWQVALILLCLAPIIGLISYLSSYAERKEMESEEMSYTAADVAAEEILSNIKTVKVYEGEDKAIARYESVLKPASKIWKWIIISGIASASLWFFVYSSYGLVFYFGRTYIISGFRNKTTCDDEVDPKNGLLENTAGSETLFVKSNTRDTLHASDVFFMIDWVSRIDNLSSQGKIPSRTAIGKIEVDNVCFRYPKRPDNEILHNIRLTVHPGQMIAFVGPAGSGKSTLLRLIQRLYDPTSGCVYLDGKNMESLNVGWVRSQIGVLSQEPILFNRTVEENVRFAKWTASPGEVQEACRMAGVHDEILQLKEGYQTVVGHRGNLLSDDEKRKISFARVFLQNPKILLLDDPIASTDTEFGETILRAVNQLRGNTTILISASEVNAMVEQAGRIYVMDKGAILERGHHHDLMLMNGMYAGIKNQTFNSNVDRTPKFISQLTSYRFAQSLRRMHIRKSLEVSADRREIVDLNEINEISFEDHHNSDTNIHAGYHRRARKTKKLGMRIAGGVQQYQYARYTTDPSHLKTIFDKGVLKIQHEKGYHSGKTEIDKSISKIMKNMRKSKAELPPPAPAQEPSSPNPHVPTPPQQGMFQRTERRVSIANQTVRFVLPGSKDVIDSGSTNSQFVLPLPKTMEADNRSVASKDSEEFWNAYTGILSNLEGFQNMTSWKDLLILGLDGWTYFIVSLLASALMGLYYPVFAILYGELFGSVADVKEANKTGNTYCILLVGLGVCATITAFVQGTVLTIGGYQMTKNLRKKLFTQILKQKMAWFDLPENDISFLCARLSSDTASIENLLMATFGVAIQSLSTISATIAFAYYLTTGLENLVSITLPMSFIILIVIYLDGWLQLNWETITDNLYKESTGLEIDVVTNIRTVITLGLEDYFRSEFLRTLRKQKTKIHLINQARTILFALSLGLPYLCYTFLISNYHHCLTENPDLVRHFKDIIKLVELLIFGIIPIGVGLSLLPNSRASRGAAYRIRRILKSNPESDYSNSKVEKRTFDTPPKVEVGDLTFVYTGRDNSVIQSLTFAVKPAGFVALVGPSGSGKSTVINLMLRLYEPTSGFIKFDGEDTSTIDIKCTKRITSLIEQNPSCFDWTIRENIAYGDNSREITLEEIIWAAEQAEVHDQIMLLEKEYDTQISSLEAGQRSFALRQRIVIARAIMRDPKLLVIDEATASNDFESDFLLLRALDRCHLNRTTIVASQRIEPIRNADLILVMNEGEFIESGTDQELLLQKGLYFNMYMGQRVVEGYEDNPDTFARERLASLGASDESFNTRRRRRRSSIAYNNYLQKRLTNYVPKGRYDSVGSALTDEFYMGDEKESTYSIQPLNNVNSDQQAGRGSKEDVQ